MRTPNVQPVRRLLFVVTSQERKGDRPGGFHLSELTHPYRVLVRAGYAIDIASPRGSARVDPDSLDLDDPVNAAFWSRSDLRQAAEQTLRLDAVDASDYAGIYFVGGHAAMWDLPDNPALVALVARLYEDGGVVGAVCHGPAGLVNVRLGDGSYLVQGRNVSCFTDTEEQAADMAGVIPFSLAARLEERGATHLPAPDFTEQVVVDERLVTGQNPASATGVGEAMLTLLQQAGLRPAATLDSRDYTSVSNIPARNG